MANRWVEFVRKWAKDHNMNYMCAMTTKQCKDAYLKAYPKPIPGGLKGMYDGAIDVEGLRDAIGGLLGDLSNLGTDGWSGSNDNIIKLAKKHKVNITKFLSKEDAGWYQEYDTVENLLEGFKGENFSKKIHLFLQDLFKLLEGYRNKGEQIGMAEQDTPAPAPPAKKVIIKVPKKKKEKKPPATDRDRAREALTNPAVAVLTNPDLVRLMGSFTKGMKPSAKVMIERASNMKGVRGKLRDAMIGFFTKIYSNSTYTNEEGEVDFGLGGRLKMDDIMAMIYAITLQTSKYSQKDLGYSIIELYPTYKQKYSLDHLKSLASRMFNKGMVEVNIPQIDMKGRHYKVEEKIDTPSTIKDSKFKYDDFRADRNA